jgi:hypothetical protein
MLNSRNNAFRRKTMQDHNNHLITMILEFARSCIQGRKDCNTSIMPSAREQCTRANAIAGSGHNEMRLSPRY